MHDLPDFELPVRYSDDVLERLLEFGAAPGCRTQPRVVYRFLRSLMTFEIRERKARRRELERFFGPQSLDDYAAQIEALRARYSLLRRPLAEWVTSSSAGSEEGS